MLASFTQKEKKAILDTMLDQGAIIVTVNTDHQGVVLPEHYKGGCEKQLKLSKRFKNPLSINTRRIAITLSFNGVEHDVVLPLKSIYHVRRPNEQEGLVFPDDMPPTALDHVWDAWADFVQQKRAEEEKNNKFLDFEEELKKLDPAKFEGFKSKSK